jgi:hypothetical protein
MTYIPEFSPYSYYQVEASTITIGWLDGEHLYSQGVVSKSFINRLWIFCQNPVHQSKGFFACQLCQVPVYGVMAQWNIEKRSLGSAEIRVIGKDNVIYAAPDLIYHYVTKHNYRPPDEFIQAVLDGPLPDTPEYEEFARKYNWHR